MAVIPVATKLLHQPAFDEFVLLVGKDVHRVDLDERGTDEKRRSLSLRRKMKTPL